MDPIRILHVEDDRCDQEAVRDAIILLARQLKLKTVAEGVENTDQARLLRELGCDLLQGYHFGRPVPAAEIMARIREPGAMT